MGAAFPDLSGDGQVTRKDILMGRGVQGLAMGGPPMMDPNMMPPAGPPMAPPPMGPPPMAPPQMGPEQALAGAEAQGQEMGMMAAEGVMQNIDGAQDYQSLIDGIRGNEQPLEARYAELGSIVGEQDAMQTPESVLALTQPAIMMTEEGAVNSGIGELMQGIAGDTSMEGQMGEGVGGLMMAQAPEPAMNAPMMEAGNTPPVNFRQGGPVEVQRLQAGGPPSAIERAKELQPAYQAYLSGGYDAQARAADLEEQRNMSQAQMLFDIAQAGLQFAGNTQGGSIAERLANSAAATQLPQRIGERAAGMLSAKQAQTAEKRQLDMAARQAALQGAETEAGYENQLALQRLKNSDVGTVKKEFKTLYELSPDGKSIISQVEFNIANERERKDYNALTQGVDRTGQPLPEGTNKFVGGDVAEQMLESLTNKQKAALEETSAERTGVILSAPATVNGITYSTDQVGYFSNTQLGSKALSGKYNKLSDTKNAETMTFTGPTGDQKTIYLGNDPKKRIEALTKLGYVSADAPPSLQAQTAAQKSVIAFKAGFARRAAFALAAKQNELQQIRLDAGGVETQQLINARREVAELKLEADAELAKYLQEDKQVFTSLRDGTLQENAVALAETKSNLQAEIVRLETGINAENREKNNEQVAKLKRKTTELELGIKLNNALQVGGAKNMHEIDMLGRGLEKDKALADYDYILDKQMETFKNDNNKAGMRLTAQLRDESTRVAKAIDLSNSLEMSGVKQLNDIEKMTFGDEQQRAFLAYRMVEENSYAIKTEGRAEKIVKRAEKRAELYQIGTEKRKVLDQIAAEGRIEIRLVDAENRANDRTLDAEQRQLSRTLAVEIREELKTKRAERRGVNMNIAEEKRLLHTTINAEGRASDIEQTTWERDRAAQLADIDGRVMETIRAEERDTRRTLNQEQRDEIYWRQRYEIERDDALDDARTALGREIAADERARIEERFIDNRELGQEIQRELRALENRDNMEIRVLNGEIVMFDKTKPNQPAQVMFGEKTPPKKNLKIAMLPNKDGVLVKSVVDMNGPRGDQVMKQITAYNRGSFTGPPASLTNLGTESSKVQGFFDRDTGRVLTSYDGKTFINDEGRPENIPSGVIPVSEQNAYTVAKSERLSADAQAQLAAIDERLIQGMVGPNGMPLKAKDVRLIRNAFVSARNGTGLWSGAASLINNVIGGLIADEEFSEFFKDFEEGRQFVKALGILGRSALAVNPRFAVAELTLLQELFPDNSFTNLLANPTTEANKLLTIKDLVDRQEVRILEAFAEGDLEKGMVSELKGKLFEIKRLQSMLGPIEYDAARAKNNLGPANNALGDVSNAVDAAVQAQIAAAQQNKED